MSFAEQLRADLAAAPMTLAALMTRASAHYYATRDPLGAAGDFTTAPEISQMFGELTGAWLADRWRAAGAPAGARLVELGPGRGTLMSDIRRAAPAAGWQPRVAFVETSPVLRAAQAAAHPDATWFDALEAVPDDGPLFLVANEFFDALPVRQLVRTPTGWRERMVATAGERLVFAAGSIDAAPLVPPPLAAAPVGSTVELCPAGTAIAAEIGARLRAHGGAALIVDYGYAGPATGDTLQAVRGHAYVDPLDQSGEADLTCHVDFAALAAAAGVRALGPVGQGAFLRALGIAARAERLKSRATAAQAAAIDAAVARLTDGEAMGELFRVMALVPGGDAPGFE